MRGVLLDAPPQFSKSGRQIIYIRSEPKSEIEKNPDLWE